MPDAGNGVRTDGSRITDNDPNDADVPTDTAFQQGFVQLLAQNFHQPRPAAARRVLAALLPARRRELR